MHVLMLAEYFFPFDRGGTEWSLYYLSKGLIDKGVKVTVLTPNYGTSDYELLDHIEIRRFPFPITLSMGTGAGISPYWHTNLIWFVLTLIAILKVLASEDIDILHIQGKYFLPAAIIAAKIFRKRTIVTLRDYQTLCPYGLCIQKTRGYKTCNYSYFFKVELFQYRNIYIKSTTFQTKVIQVLSAFRGKIVSSILQLFCRGTDQIISVSESMKRILAVNGISSKVIYNPMPLIKGKSDATDKEIILFVGRLTHGKGAHLIVPAFSSLLKKNKRVVLACVGKGYLKETLIKQTKDLKIDKKVIFMGHQSHKKTLDLVSNASIVVVPSVWEEPFGRVALEAIMCGTPVVATNSGALPEIVDHGKTGILVEPTVSSLTEGLEEALKKKEQLISHILNFDKYLVKKFWQNPINEHLSLYSNFD